jgi:transcription initiation factor IIE alpha subunit
VTPEATTSRRGRPPGKFKYQTEVLYDLLKHKSPCHLTDNELAEKLRIGERQVARYIRQLKKQGRIGVSLRRLQRSGNVWMNDRTITIMEEHL